MDRFQHDGVTRAQDSVTKPSRCVAEIRITGTQKLFFGPLSFIICLYRHDCHVDVQRENSSVYGSFFFKVTLNDLKHLESLSRSRDNYSLILLLKCVAITAVEKWGKKWMPLCKVYTVKENCEKTGNSLLIF